MELMICMGFLTLLCIPIIIADKRKDKKKQKEKDDAIELKEKKKAGYESKRPDYIQYMKHPNQMSDSEVLEILCHTYSDLDPIIEELKTMEDQIKRQKIQKSIDELVDSWRFWGNDFEHLEFRISQVKKAHTPLTYSYSSGSSSNFFNDTTIGSIAGIGLDILDL